MNKNIFLAFAWMIVLTSVGCSLDLTPISSKSVDGFYTTDAEFDQAIAGVYNVYRTIKVSADYSYGLSESRSDNAFQEAIYDPGKISRFEETSNLALLSSAWGELYNGINRCNTILERLEIANSLITPAKSQQIKGEALLFRSLFYFDLVRYFGGVPLVDKSISITEGYAVKRATTSETYAFIRRDMKEAIELLPTNLEKKNKGRVDKYSAKAYYAKVLIFESGYPVKNNNWDEAKIVLKEVIDSGRYQFFDSYDAIFEYVNEQGKQQIYSHAFKTSSSGQGNPFPTRNAPNAIAKTGTEDEKDMWLIYGGSPYNLFVTDDIIASYEEGDSRLTSSVQRQWNDVSGNIRTDQMFCKKYQNGPVSTASDWDIDFIDYRFDEVLLFYAECLNELGYTPDGEAFDLVNMFRTRAGLKPKTSAEIKNQNDFRMWIENERRWEFTFENIRWFDLVRTDRALDVLSAYHSKYTTYAGNVTRNKYVYPIPQRVIDENPAITQNPE